MDQRIIRKPELFARVGLSDATIWRLEKSGKFPRRVKLGGNSVGWMSDEFETWLNCLFR
ncbi:MAG: AlpA family phage regulatory protein [Syntrophaceae bacterium]|nr:AlpA family phage regulatory protein [Syntrophaceae bacterium]